MNKIILRDVLIPVLLQYLDITTINNLEDCFPDMKNLILYAIDKYIIKIEGIFLNENKNLVILTSLQKDYKTVIYRQHKVHQVMYVNDPVDEYIKYLPCVANFKTHINFKNYMIYKSLDIPIRQIYKRIPLIQNLLSIHDADRPIRKFVWEIQDTAIPNDDGLWVLCLDWRTTKLINTQQSH